MWAVISLISTKVLLSLKKFVKNWVTFLCITWIAGKRSTLPCGWCAPSTCVQCGVRPRLQEFVGGFMAFKLGKSTSHVYELIACLFSDYISANVGIVIKWLIISSSWRLIQYPKGNFIANHTSSRLLCCQLMKFNVYNHKTKMPDFFIITGIIFLFGTVKYLTPDG